MKANNFGDAIKNQSIMMIAASEATIALLIRKGVFTQAEHNDEYDRQSEIFKQKIAERSENET